MSAEDHKKSRAPETLCVHAGEEHHGTNDSLTTEISQGSVFVVPNTNELRKYAEGDSKAYLYSRYANPTVAVAERKIAALEGAESAVVTSSGMAAIMSLVLSTCRTGDEIVSMLDLYGGTTHLLQDTLSKYGVTTRFVPYNELCKIEDYFTKKTRLLFLETPTNPTLRCVDIASLAKLGHQKHTCVVVDNTFASPMLQRPLELGADVVVHSATKLLGGHNDVTAGVIAGSADWVEPAREMMKQSGGCLDPLAAYLLIRGLKTLGIRVERATDNAQEIAAFLESHPKVSRVFYPGLKSNQSHEIAKKQMSGFGTMLSFEHKGGGEGAEKFIDSLKLWYLATSLGGVESTVSYPFLSSHVGLSPEQLEQLDVSPATVRLSVGIENVADLVADLKQALDRG